MERIRQIIAEKKLDGFIVTNLKNVRYLTGYTGSNGLVYIDSKEAFFFTDFRYKTQVEKEVKKGFIIEIADRSLIDYLNEKLSPKGKIGFESRNVTYDHFTTLKENLPDAELIPQADIVEKLRQVKNRMEIDNIRRAIEISEKALEQVKHLIRQGTVEKEFAHELIYAGWKFGAEDPSFDPIVASGVNSAKPHAGISERAMQRGDFVTIDYGFFFNGYASDITRTFIIGEPSPKQREIYEKVLEAQLAAEKAMMPGAKMADMDKTARDIITEAGYGEFFGHSLGHSIGLAVHDPGSLSSKAEGELTPGMVFTNEPGIYIPDLGGVRIEDDILITTDGNENLVTLPKSIEEMIV